MAVLTANTKRETGKKAQSGNIMAAKVNWQPFWVVQPQSLA